MWFHNCGSEHTSDLRITRRTEFIYWLPCLWLIWADTRNSSIPWISRDYA